MTTNTATPAVPATANLHLHLQGLLFADAPSPAARPAARHDGRVIWGVNDAAKRLGLRPGELAVNAVRRVPEVILDRIDPDAGRDLALWAAKLAAAILPAYVVRLIGVEPDEAHLTVTPAPSPERTAVLLARLCAAGIRAVPTEAPVAHDDATVVSVFTPVRLTLPQPAADPQRWRRAVERLLALHMLTRGLGTAQTEEALPHLQLVLGAESGRTYRAPAVTHADPGALLSAAYGMEPFGRVKTVALDVTEAPEWNDAAEPADPFIGMLSGRLGASNVFRLGVTPEGATRREAVTAMAPASERLAAPETGSHAPTPHAALFEASAPLKLRRLWWEGPLTIETQTGDDALARNPSGLRVVLKRDGDGWLLLGRCA